MIDLKKLKKFLEDNKLKNISIYNLSTPNEEKYVVLTTASSVQMSKNVADLIAQEYSYQDKIEGYFKGEWIIFDFSSVVLHIFLAKTREKYNMDKLYKPLKWTINS